MKKEFSFFSTGDEAIGRKKKIIDLKQLRSFQHFIPYQL